MVINEYRSAEDSGVLLCFQHYTPPLQVVIYCYEMFSSHICCISIQEHIGYSLKGTAVHSSCLLHEFICIYSFNPNF